MQDNKLPNGKECIASENPLEETTTYHIEGRSFVVKPVFKDDSANTFVNPLRTRLTNGCRARYN